MAIRPAGTILTGRGPGERAVEVSLPLAVELLDSARDLVRGPGVADRYPGKSESILRQEKSTTQHRPVAVLPVARWHCRAGWF